MDGRLLVGNYSRVGFNHPGPGILAMQAAGQAVFQRALDVVSAPYAGQFLGIIALNAICIGVATAVVYRWSGSAAAALALPAVAVVVNVWEPVGLASTWMPHTYIAPFLLMSVAAASVVAGSWRHLWAFALGGGFLVHGHVSFVLFVGATTVAVLGAAVLLGRRSRARQEQDVDRDPLRPPSRPVDWLAGGAVVGAFALPVVVNLVLHWPGELERYVDYSSDRSGFAPRSAGDVARFVGYYWTRGGVVSTVLVVAAGISALLAAVGWMPVPARHRRFVVAALGVVALEVLLLGVYAVRGVDDLSQHYIGFFGMTGPVVVLWTGLSSIVLVVAAAVPRPMGRVAAGLVVAVVTVLVFSQATIANPYRGLQDSDAMLAAIGPGPVRLDFATPGWPTALGLMEQLRRRGRDVCVVNPVWRTLVTGPNLCTATSPGTDVDVYGPGEVVPPTGHVTYEVGGTTIVAG